MYQKQAVTRFGGPFAPLREVTVATARNASARSIRLAMIMLFISMTAQILCVMQIYAEEISTSSVFAPQPPDLVDVPPPWPSYSWQNDLHTRTQLSGDWYGVRDEIAEHGLTMFGDLTQYYQGVTTGGSAQQFKYGIRADYLVDVDTQKLGLWEGGHFDLRGETRQGQDTNGIDGTVALSNFAMALPLLNQNVTALTGVQYTQELSENLTVFLGKLNLLDGTPEKYARGMRLNYFWNAAMQSNLTRTYLIPSSLGIGFTIRDNVEPVFSFYLLDTNYIPATSGFSTLFNNGVVAYGEYRQRTQWWDLPGHSAFGLLYSTATRTAIDSDPYLLLESIITGGPVPTKDSSWTVTYRLDQVLYANQSDPRRNWTLFSDVGLTDGSPNPIRWFMNVALVGGSVIRGRENDTVGIGYYHLGVSKVPLLTIHGIEAENGVELFYNAAVTPWFHVTPDVQILDPAQQRNATALLIGIRARLSF